MAEKNTGLLLARWVRKEGLSVVEVAEYTGATRATVYNWLAGNGVSPAYRARVYKLIEKLSGKPS